MGEILSFKHWLCTTYKNNDSYFGDLAKDVANDDDFPESGSMDDLVLYIEKQGASEAAVNVLVEAFGLFEKNENN